MQRSLGVTNLVCAIEWRCGLGREAEHDNSPIAIPAMAPAASLTELEVLVLLKSSEASESKEDTGGCPATYWTNGSRARKIFAEVDAIMAEGGLGGRRV